MSKTPSFSRSSIIIVKDVSWALHMPLQQAMNWNMSMCTMSVGLTDHLTDTEVTSMNKLLIYKVVGGQGGQALYGVSCVVFSCFSLWEDLLNTVFLESVQILSMQIARQFKQSVSI